MILLSYDDEPECIDLMYAAARKGCNPVACGESSLIEPHIRPWKRYPGVKLLCDMTEEEQDSILTYLEELEKCPICKQEFNPYDIWIHYCKKNGQYAWFCHNCRNLLNKPKRECWHKIPAFKRINKTIDTDDDLLNYIIVAQPINIRKASEELGWSYGKTRGAAMRLHENGLIRVSEIHKNNYKESLLYYNNDNNK